MIQKSLDRSLADGIRSARKLAQHALLPVGLQPRGSTNDALDADLRAHTVGACAGPVAVEVLVHLVDDLVLRVGEGS